MRTPILRGGRPARLASVLVLGAAALAACSDGQPIVAPEPGPAMPEHVIQTFDCTGSTAGFVRCQPAVPGTGEAAGAIIGGQNVYVTLASTNVSYDSQTEIFQFDVTVQNLLNEAIGTPDGTTPDPDGIQLFFRIPPAVTDGEGVIDVLNEDGTAFFTDADQEYFAYHEILAKDEVSAARTWQLSVPNTVNTFNFRVSIETDMQYLLVINEVLTNPAGATYDTNGNGDWFEIYNAGTWPVNLQNLVIADSTASGRRPYHLIASSVNVPSGGYVTLGNNSNTVSNGGVTLDYAYGTALNLSQSLDAVKIARVWGTDTLTIDRTQYSNAAVSAQDGVSRELKNPALDNSNMDGSNWGSASVTSVYGAGGRGTPQAQNSAYTP